MITAGKGRLVALAAVAVGATVALAGCASSDPLDSGSGETDGGGETLVVGSQDYYSNEIIAELYAQALEANGFTVELQPRIGQREVYMPEIESGSIDVFPEYTGNLLQYYVPDTTATTADDVYAELETSLPEGLRVLDQSPATDQDSYNVTKEFSEQNDVTSLADLAKVTTPLTLGGNSELATRPYGPEGLKSVYGVDVAFTPIEDSGGPLTLKALQDGDVQLVNIFSANPAIATSDLVTLEDPEGLFLASNVVPVVSEKVDDKAAEVINTVSAALTADELVALNAKSVDDQESAEQIASDWLAEQSLF
ncbi:ABC transporter substrate-binding protein [Agromyces sp. S2-1-8]|jgi:osmoprotectant transport system substrate-binding protein|uniref:ABC transporter substrate-binding protein n=1 Tax=unclassified Agromyces TaxID=2639701 RepID=UPI001E4763C0|nr:ABC transporter substrate-binding protein [Agromyces sp. S2-1-8]MCD5347336.1 ABC transporter substrate-binding protein [Agromyces sp. S2-1-8]